MAECVSCGRPVEAGKLFCEQCYARMKGRRGPFREVGSAREATRGQVIRTRGERDESQPPGIPEGMKEKRESLTPATEKKVVILRPELEKYPRKDRESRFTITITFSERTYRMLSRLKPGRGKGKAGEEGAEAAAPTSRSAGRKHKGPHGRPALRALEGKAGTLRGTSRKRGGFSAWAAFRPRKLDGGDLLSLGTAAISVVCILVLTFVPWVRMTWVAMGGVVAGETSIRGSDLGILTYLALAVVLAAAAYVPISLWLKERFAYVDYGLVLLAAGLVFIILFYANISSSQRMVDLAFRLAGTGGGVSAEDLERHTSWTAYLVSFMGLVLAFSGLVRLSERREPQEEQGGGG
ncbi:hypothetical protein [Candidatus Solincola tengchongensis]|uniref:hypothetical protein n=1 Tax=Candidatus Solincola tengchongensis TaxID=2900693 RepID=UPI00257BAE74|nr:hypothetical protein [Candidatus Solincola tengchongensis]